MSGVLVSVTQNGRETGTAMNADFFFSFSLTNKQNYRCTQPRTCIKLVMRNLGRLSRMKNAFLNIFFKLPKIFGEEEELEDWH